MIHDLRLTFDDREKDTYNLLCQNLTNKEIADRLNVSEAAIAKRVRSIYKKLNLESLGVSNKQATRRAAILYSGTKLEQTINLNKEGEKTYSMEQIKQAFKRLGKNRSLREESKYMQLMEDLLFFLEENS